MMNATISTGSNVFLVNKVHVGSLPFQHPVKSMLRRDVNSQKLLNLVEWIVCYIRMGSSRNIDGSYVFHDTAGFRLQYSAADT